MTSPFGWGDITGPYHPIPPNTPLYMSGFGPGIQVRESRTFRPTYNDPFPQIYTLERTVDELERTVREQQTQIHILQSQIDHLVSIQPNHRGPWGSVIYPGAAAARYRDPDFMIQDPPATVEQYNREVQGRITNYHHIRDNTAANRILQNLYIPKRQDYDPIRDAYVPGWDTGAEGWNQHDTSTCGSSVCFLVS